MKMSRIVKVIEGPDGEAMYFVGSREIEKPKLLADPLGTIVAFSEYGSGGKKHIFALTKL